MAMNPDSPLVRSLAAVCTICPLCVVRRRFPHGGYARFMRRIERGCPFCRAYDAVHRGSSRTEPAPPASR